MQQTLLLEDSELGPRIVLNVEDGIADLAFWSGIRKFSAVVLTGVECTRLGQMLIEAGMGLQQAGAPEWCAQCEMVEERVTHRWAHDKKCPEHREADCWRCSS